MSGWGTVSDLLRHRAEVSPDAEAWFVRDEQGWRAVRWREAMERARALAAGLSALGVGPGARIGVLSRAREGAALAELAIALSGGIAVGVDPRRPDDELLWILEDSGASVFFAEGDAEVARLVAARAQAPGLERVITFDGRFGHDGWVMRLEELESRGREGRAGGDVDAPAGAIAALTYTAGASGRPRAAAQTHQSWLAVATALAATGLILPSDRWLCWAPLDAAVHRAWWLAALFVGAPALIEPEGAPLDAAAARSPSWAVIPTRPLEQLYHDLTAEARALGGWRERALDWSLSLGERALALQAQGRGARGLLALQLDLAERLVLRVVRARFGDRLRFLVAAGDALDPTVARFFALAGAPILWSWGTSGAGGVSALGALEGPAGCGRPLEGVEVQIRRGEVLLRGPGLASRWRGPAIDDASPLRRDEWLETGDLGTLDDAGRLWIGGRRGALQGVDGPTSPASIEAALRARCPWIDDALAIGDGGGGCVALLSLDGARCRAWAASQGRGAALREELARDPDLRALIAEGVEAVNRELEAPLQIKGFTILPDPLRAEDGARTLDGRPRQAALVERYREQVSALLAGEGPRDEATVGPSADDAGASEE